MRVCDEFCYTNADEKYMERKLELKQDLSIFYIVSCSLWKQKLQVISPRTLPAKVAEVWAGLAS